MESFYYFAYGVHMDIHELERLNIPVLDHQLCVLPHYALKFNVLDDEFFIHEKRGLANIEPKVGSQVEGVLYHIADLNDLPKIDNDLGVPELKYYRKEVRVKLENGSKITAITYAAWPDVTSHGLLPSRDYLHKVILAVQCRQVSHDFLHWLQRHPTTF